MALGGKDLNYWVTKRDFAKLDLEAILALTPVSNLHHRLREAEAVDALEKALAAYETLVAIAETLSRLERPPRT